MRNSVLITGGAGYIGSHVARQLGEAGHHVVIVDDLSKGFREAALGAELVIGDFGDQELVERLIAHHRIDAVMHFAAHTVVPESVARPLEYYRNNTIKSHSLIAACVGAGIEHFIFSSTAAVYGIPDTPLVSEESPTVPINPYGTSKLMTEWMLRDAAAASNLRHVTLRYFNVAGSDPQCRVGQSTPKATLLIKVACEAAVGKRDMIGIYGTDYPTPDGTGVRDYIHVEDLAAAHLRALGYLQDGGQSTTLNCGYGHGYSVRQVLDAVERIAGKKLDIREQPRRAGDPPALVAKAERIVEVLGWSPRYDDLDAIVRSSIEWEKHRRY